MGLYQADHPHTGYYITNDEGDVLTSVKNPRALEWTAPALMEEQNRRAVLYRNPYRISHSIAKQFQDSFLIFRIHISRPEFFADSDAIFNGQCIGHYGGFKAAVPGIMHSHIRQHDWNERII